MSEDMESKGIFFDLQWKTKTGVSSGEEFASIGIWEVDDSSLDWLNFKPYLCQTLGNVENLSISYVDSDGDVIPIDSDCEFQEALKYARRKAAMGQKIILKVEKLDSQSGGTELSSSPIYIKSSNFIKERFKIHTNNAEEQNPFRLPAAEGPIKIGNLSCKVKSKSKTKDVLCPLQNCDSPPMWFKKYMQKMKSEIVSEVTASVSCQVKKMLEDLGHKGPPIVFPAGSRFHSGSDFTDAWLITKTKKKIVDDDSSDGAPKVEIRDSKILKKIEKIHRREKKLDHKKEKLEQKSKKMAERKEREYLSKLRLERAGCKRSHNESLSQKPREAEIVLTPRRMPKAPENIETLPPPPLDPECSQVGVAVQVDDKRAMAVKRGSKFTKVWKVMNTGNVLWTDGTEVRLSWGSAGLDPETRVLKCPPLPPGEMGDISINFTAPDYPGLFESHWHFFHENIRFGKSISFIISVEPITNSENEQGSYQNLSSVNSAEFCMIPSTSFGVNNERDNMVGNDGESSSSSATEETFAGSASQEKIIPKISSFSSASVPMGSIDDQDDTIEKEDNSLSDKRKGLEFESISTDDLSGSVASLGSDSDDNFVVVPMPPCFRFDVPLNAEQVAAKAENSETKEVPESPNHQQQASSQEIVNNENVETANITNDLPTQERSEVSCDTGEVISVPVTATMTPPPGLRRPLMANPPTIPVTVPVTATKTPLFGEPSRPQVVMPSTTPPSVPVTATKTPLFAGLSRPQVAEPPTTSASPRQSPESQVPLITWPLQSHSSINVSKSPPSASLHPPTSPQESPENSGIRGSPLPTDVPGSQQKNGSRPPSSSSSRGSSRPIDLMPPVVSEVWNGAMNATASALNSAFAALDSILVNPSGTSDSNGHVYGEPPSGPQQPVQPQRPLDVKMINSLSKLANMGFYNLQLNEALLRVHNHNIAEVVDALLDRDDTDPLPQQTV